MGVHGCTALIIILGFHVVGQIAYLILSCLQVSINLACFSCLARTISDQATLLIPCSGAASLPPKRGRFLIIKSSVGKLCSGYAVTTVGKQLCIRRTVLKKKRHIRKFSHPSMPHVTSPIE